MSIPAMGMNRNKFHEPETNEKWSEHGRFHVYVLATTKGHYVGHTGNIKKRLNDHYNNRVFSTMDSSPKLLWKSGVFKSRLSASKYEAALKSWRDSMSPEFKKHTGIMPIPYSNASNKSFLQRSRRGKFIGRKSAPKANKARRVASYLRRSLFKRY